MMKGIDSPFKTNLLISIPITPNTRMFMVSNDQETRVAFCANRAAATKVSTASRAVQGTKGIRNIVNNLSLLDSTILVPKTDGTLHPNPRHIGIKLFP